MRYAFTLFAVLLIVGCDTPPPTNPASSNRPTGGQDRDADRPLAFVDGRSVRLADLRAGLLASAGGEALFNLVLDRAITERLDAGGVSVMEADVDAERAALLRSLDPDDEDRAVRLLRRLRERRGLGPRRFAALLERNAGLRKLVRATRDTAVDEAELRIAYTAAYGPRAQVRLALLPTMPDARQLRRAVRESASPEARFIELAVQRSIDPSSARGGLLQPVSPADTAYPPAFRQALAGFQDRDPAPRGGELSPVVALGEGFAVLQWVRGVPGRDVAFEDVRDDLAETLRLRREREAMDALARGLIAEADVTVLDPVLSESWRRRLDAAGQTD